MSLIVLCAAADCHIKRINSQYRRGIKLVSSERHIPVEKKMNNLNLLPLKDHFFFNSVTLTFKALNNLAPKYLTECLQLSTRNESTNFVLPNIRIEKI